jgi:hypothetical protein
MSHFRNSALYIHGSIFYIREVGDAVEENAFKTNGVDVSDFVSLVVRGLF